MNRKKASYWENFKEILGQRPLLFLAIFVGVLCFGFTITHYSIGIDDAARNYYLYSQNENNMIQQGRLLHIVLNELTHTVQFIPFFTEFIGASLYVLSALLLCALFRYVTDGRISMASLAVFTGVYISSSILAEKYIYHLDVLATMLSYCCNALALLYSYRFVREKNWKLFFIAVPILMGAIASYESYVFLYISGVFALFILEIAINGENKTFRELLMEGLKYAGILLTALLVYYGLVFLVQMVTGQIRSFFSSAVDMPENMGRVETLVYIMKSMIRVFAKAISDRYIPILVFCLCSALNFGLLIYLTIRRKNVWLGLCFLALWVCNFGIHFVAGAFLYRAAQTFCFFCGFVLMMLLEILHRPVLKKLFCMAAALLIFVQGADMNRWFYNDYVRYQKESYAIHVMANEILGNCDAGKPVVFTNVPYQGYLDTSLYSGRQVNGNSLLYWCGYAYQNKQQPFISEVFRMHGYDFIQSPTEEEYERACLEAEGMAAWPQEGSIQEFADFIVVNFG